MLNIFKFLKNSDKKEPDSLFKPVNPEPIPPRSPSFNEDSMSQQQMTHQIIEESPLNSSATIDELDRIAQERSDRLYNERQQRIHKFNPFELNIHNVDTSPLSSVERAFLKQMNGQSVENPTVNAYWIYEYSLDFEATMTRLIVNHYLQISDAFMELDFLTVIELKAILKQYNLGIAGKKKELIQRIKTNVSSEQLSATLNGQTKRYILTAKGTEVIADLPLSMTKNLELEDHCLDCIYKRRLNEAYRLVCKNELSKVIPRGIGMDWKQEYDKGLSDFKLQLYTAFLEQDEVNIPKILKTYENQLKACAILGDFFGVATSKSGELFLRITDCNHISKSEVIPIMQEMQFKLATAIQEHTLDILKS